MIKQSQPTRWVRSVLLVAVAGVLVWQVMTKSYAAYLTHTAPESALIFQPLEPVALVTLADATLNPAPSENGAGANAPKASVAKPELSTKVRDRLGAWAELAIRAARKALPPDKRNRPRSANAAKKLSPPPVSETQRNQARAQAELALLHDPLNARALRILGQIADSTGDNAKAAQLMQAAADRSWSESVAIYWLLVKSYETGDYATSLRYTDAFLRKRPQFVPQAMPVLSRIAESKDDKAVGALKTLIMSEPPWRTSFFSRLPGAITNARTPLQLLLSIKDSSSPPTVADLRSYLNFLVARGFYELAYYTWLQFLPPNQLARAGFLANGSFEYTPSGLPFDWVISRGSTGITTDIGLRPELDGQRALYLEFGPGRAHFRGVSQVLMLGPGSYELKGRLKGEVIGRRGLQWTITCAGGPREQIGKTDMFLGIARSWRDFAIPFTVPKSTDCRAQKLRLTHTSRSESERLVTGLIWYDEMQISRVAKTELPKPTRPDTRLNQSAQPATGVTAAKDTRMQSPSPEGDQQSQTAPMVTQ